MFYRSKLWLTYGQEEINHIHEAEDHVRCTGVAVHVGDGDQCTCDDVVSEHLCMIFPASFNVDDEDLLEPKCQLHQIIPFEGS